MVKDDIAYAWRLLWTLQENLLDYLSIDTIVWYFICLAFFLPLPFVYFQAFQSMASRFGGSGSLQGPLSLWKHIKESFTLKIEILKILDLNLTERRKEEKKGIV